MDYIKILITLFIIILIYLIYNKRKQDELKKVLSISSIPKQETIDITQLKDVRTWIQLDNYGNYGLYVANPDAFYIYDKTTKEMKNIIDTIPELKSSAKTYAAISVDINNDGLMDLIIARENGVFIYLNQSNLNQTHLNLSSLDQTTQEQTSFNNNDANKIKFEVSNILPKSEKTIPVSLAITDYNKDGQVDIYVSQHTNPKYKTINPNYVAKNVILEGLGAGSFSVDQNSLDEAGNNAQWLDTNNDNLIDLKTDKSIYLGNRGGSAYQFASSGFIFTEQQKQQSTSLKKPTNFNDGTITNEYINNIPLQTATNKVNYQTPNNISKPTNQSNQSNLITHHINLTSRDPNIIKQQILKKSISTNNQKQIEDHLNHSWATLDGAYKRIEQQDQSKVDDYKWLNICINRNDLKKYSTTTTNNQPNNNFIAVRLPPHAPFLDAYISVCSSSPEKPTEIHNQEKQVQYTSNDPLNNITIFNLNQDTIINKLEVLSTIDGGNWYHPSPKLNTIATLREMTINP